MAKSLETARNKEAYLQALDDDALMKEWTAVCRCCLQRWRRHITWDSGANKIFTL